MTSNHVVIGGSSPVRSEHDHRAPVVHLLYSTVGRLVYATDESSGEHRCGRAVGVSQTPTFILIQVTQAQVHGVTCVFRGHCNARFCSPDRAGMQWREG
jgi:hypothetical protein